MLHIVHGWPPFAIAGTEQYAAWLARLQAQSSEVVVYARAALPQYRDGDSLSYQEGALRIRLRVNHFHRRDPLARNALRDRSMERELRTLLDEVRPEIVHVHHLAGHAASLLSVVRQARIPVIYQVQDWWALCGRVNLVNRAGEPCPGPTLARCSSCQPLTRRWPRAIWNPLLHVVRRRSFREALSVPQVFVMGSQTVLEDHRARGLLTGDAPARVSPYPVFPTDGSSDLRADVRGRSGDPRASDGSRPAHREPIGESPELPSESPATLVLGFVGSILPHKGVHLLAEAVERLGERSRRVRVEIWGDPTADPEYTTRIDRSAPPGCFQFRGRFDDSQRAEILAGLQVLVVPSIGRESYGLVAHEALLTGTSVLAARHSALEETLSGLPGAHFFTPGAVEELADQLSSWLEGLDEGVAIDERTEVERASRARNEDRLRDHLRDLRKGYGQALTRKPLSARSSPAGNAP